MEWWNIGIMEWRPSGRLNACGEKREAGKLKNGIM